jgi:hypothetical protein
MSKNTDDKKAATPKRDPKSSSGSARDKAKGEKPLTQSDLDTVTGGILHSTHGAVNFRNLVVGIDQAVAEPFEDEPVDVANLACEAALRASHVCRSVPS